jgi:hypothetical protein
LAIAIFHLVLNFPVVPEAWLSRLENALLVSYRQRGADDGIDDSELVYAGRPLRDFAF